MKILCDVCNKKEASVFCTADEAALCDGCDHSIHHANKLASKHQRFSLLQPSLSLFPLCDVCQEKRAILFCQEDRAILCRECEIPLHTANEHTQKHNRFLLTGIRLSSTVMVSETTSNKDDIITIRNNNNEGETDTVPNFKFTGETISEFSGNSNPNSATTTVGTDNSNNTTVISSANNNDNNNNTNNMLMTNGGTATVGNNISEYLIDMLPGWHFEELLADSVSPPAFDFPKVQNGGNKLDGFEVNEDVLSFFDVENEDRDFTSAFGHQSENFWVPQAGPVITAGISNVFGQQPYSLGIHHNHSFTTGLIHDPKYQHQQHSNMTTMKMNRKCLKDDVFAVPQITSSVGSKRNRPFW